NGVPTSGGVSYPYDYTTSRHQVNGKATYYADQFLKSQHEFKFGVQFSRGFADTISGLGPNGSYTVYFPNPYGPYPCLYDYYQVPFHYGSTSQELGTFVDDTVTLNSRFTLNLGVRFDRNAASIPDFDQLAVGTPSITKIANFKTTGQIIPGVKDLID